MDSVQDSKIKLKSKESVLSTGKKRFNNQIQDMDENLQDRVIKVQMGDIQNK